MMTLAEAAGQLFGATFDTKWLAHPAWMGCMNKAAAEFLREQGWVCTAPGEPAEPPRLVNKAGS